MCAEPQERRLARADRGRTYFVHSRPPGQRFLSRRTHAEFRSSHRAGGWRRRGQPDTARRGSGVPRAVRGAGRSLKRTACLRPPNEEDRVSRPKAWLSWSSGKDSAWALHTTRKRGDVEIVALLTTVNSTHARVAMHAVRESLLEAQAEAVGLPLVKVPIPSPCPNEVYEQAMAEAMRQATTEG